MSANLFAIIKTRCSEKFVGTWIYVLEPPKTVFPEVLIAISLEDWGPNCGQCSYCWNRRLHLDVSNLMLGPGKTFSVWFSRSDWDWINSDNPVRRGMQTLLRVEFTVFYRPDVRIKVKLVVGRFCEFKRGFGSELNNTARSMFCSLELATATSYNSSIAWKSPEFIFLDLGLDSLPHISCL